MWGRRISAVKPRKRSLAMTIRTGSEKGTDEHRQEEIKRPTSVIWDFIADNKWLFSWRTLLQNFNGSITRNTLAAVVEDLQVEGSNFCQLINFEKMVCEIRQVSLPPEIDAQTARLPKMSLKEDPEYKMSLRKSGSFNDYSRVSKYA